MRHIIRIISTVDRRDEEAAVRALSAIDGVRNPRVVNAADDGSMILEYEWDAAAPMFWRTDEVLGQFGYRRDWEYDPLRRLIER
jgi:hypothetical protein